MKIKELVRPNIVNLRPFSSARSEFSGDAEIFLDANENPFPSPINRYPDPHHRKLKKALAEANKVGPGQLIIGNGSDEVIDMLIRTFCRPGIDIIRYIHPSFGMYKVSAGINDIKAEAIPLAAEFSLDAETCIRDQTENHKLLFLCSPNNPTGNSFKREILEWTIKNFKGIVVLDEAYIEFSEQESLVNLLPEYPNLVILRTFSKAFASAAIRVGYAIASAEIISYVSKIKPPYNVGTPSQEWAIRQLESRKDLEKLIGLIKTEREKLKKLLQAFPFVERIFQSDANFLLVKFLEKDRLKKYLQDNGIIVRDRSNLPGCESCLRITIGTQEENKILMMKLKEFDR